ncbi:MAG: ATP-binding protein, partial [Nitrospiraceae bacterium]
YRLLKTVAPMSPEEIRRRLQVQKSWTGELCHTTRDGREVIIESRQQLVVNEGRRLVLETNRDITERKRVEAELKRSVDQLHALSQRLEVVREEERSRIARELHDELGVMLTCLKMDLSRLTVLTRDASDQDRSKTEEKIRSMTEHVDNTIASVQRLVAELRPGVLDDLGLVAALEWQCQDFERRSGIACSCECDQEEIDVPASCSTAAFRICREALMNVVRHAQATMAHVRLKHEDEHLRLDIRDNGSGIPSDKLTDSRSLGLLGMRERAETLRGHLEITGWPGQGTTVTVRFPLAQPVRRETEA